MTRPGILQPAQNSLIMLSLDLPTPTHFTEIRKDRRRRAASAEAPTAGLQSEDERSSKPTWNLQEVLDEADVVLGLRWQLLKAPYSLGDAAPAGQRLVLHRHSRQNVHIRCDRSMKTWTTEGRSKLTDILRCSAIFMLRLVKSVPKPNERILVKAGQTYLGS